MADKLATIERIDKLEKHPDADRLLIAHIGTYRCITGLDSFKEGDLCVLIQPDSVLPDQDWAIPYKKFCPKRVKAQKIRGEWSFGLAIPINEIPLNDIEIILDEHHVGTDVTDILGVTKYVDLTENRLDARRSNLPYNIPKTDETTWRGFRDLYKKFGQIVDVTEKIDGQSCSIYFYNGDFGITSRGTDYKLDSLNTFTAHLQRYPIQEELTKFCIDNKVNLAIRGESYGGNKIQNFKHNPYSKLPFGLALFSVWNIDEMRYCRKGDKYYIFDIADKFSIPTVPLLEKDIILSQELINKYEKELDKINDKNFEGVVINGQDFSFKVINFYYDQLK